MGTLVVYSVALDWLYRAVAVGAWVLLGGWGRGASRRGPLPPLWWAGCAVAVAATLRTVPATLVLDRVSGQQWLSVPFAHLLTVGAAAVAVADQLATRQPMTRLVRRGLYAAAAAGGALLVVTWWPARPSGTSTTGAGGPVVVTASGLIIAHQTVFGLLVALAAVTVGISVLRELVDAAAGPWPVQLGLMAAVAGCVTAWGAVQAGAVAAPLWGGGIAADTLAGLDIATLGLAAMLAAAAVVVYRRSLRSTPEDPHRVHDDVVRLREWLAGPDPDAGAAPGGGDVFGLLVEVCDRVWMLQQRISPQQLARAEMVARSAGLLGQPGQPGRAFAAAVALEVGMRNDPDLRPPRPADISRLGGGQDEAQEARWLAAVQRARTEHPVSTAANWVLEHTPPGELRARATTETTSQQNTSPQCTTGGHR